MMFATLDDLDGSVEIVVFEKALAAAEERDRRRRDRARPRQRRSQGGRQGLRHRPGRRRSSTRRTPRSRRPRRRWPRSPPRVPRRSSAASTPPSCPPRSSTTCASCSSATRARREFVLEMHTRTGLRRLKFGARAYRVDGARRGPAGRARRLLRHILGARHRGYAPRPHRVAAARHPRLAPRHPRRSSANRLDPRRCSASV